MVRQANKKSRTEREADELVSVHQRHACTRSELSMTCV